MRRMIRWHRRPLRFPRYVGAAYWTTFLFLFGYAALSSGFVWGAVCGAGFVLLLAIFLWWYGVLPRPQRA
jgi:hypothetical protein